MAEYRYNYFEAVGGKLTGRIGVEPFDPNDPGTTAHIIRIGNPLDLRVAWELAGEFAPYVGGDWELTLTCRNTDGVGRTEGELDKVSVPLDSVSAKSTPRRYTHTFRVPPGRVEPGIYQFTVNLSYVNAGFLGAISGFAETGPIEFYRTG